MFECNRRRPRPMQTVTVQVPSGVVAVPEPAKAVTLADVEVATGLPCYGEFECEWALDRADK
jgi:hypothetical protein